MALLISHNFKVLRHLKGKTTYAFLLLSPRDSGEGYSNSGRLSVRRIVVIKEVSVNNQ
jgi:hypothetical protein